MRHDMRNAVGIGRGYLTMLLGHYDDLSPEQRARVVEGVARAFDRLDEFTRRVLIDEKLLTHDDVLQRGPVAVADVAGEIRRAYPVVSVVVEPSVPECVVADPVLLREAVDNLVANALVAAPDRTAVTVTLRGPALRIEVHDCGEGPTEADRAVLFTRYGLTERSLRTQPRGLGLGLAIVARVVAAHGGTYGVDTGEGTTFWIELPVSPEGEMSPVRHDQDPPS